MADKKNDNNIASADTNTSSGADKDTSMKAGGQRQSSQLFLVRLWAEQENNAEAGDDDPHWRGKAQHVVTGEAHSFSNWAGLIDILLAMLPGDDSRR